MATSLNPHENFIQNKCVKKDHYDVTAGSGKNGAKRRIYRDFSVLLSITLSFMWLTNIFVGSKLISSDTVMGNHISNKITKERPSSKYAYAWIIGAISEKDLSYKGFLWDILISAHILRKHGSTADFWVYTRLSPDSNLTDLPEEDKHAT